MALSFRSDLLAQGTARLRVRVTVVPVATAVPVQPSQATPVSSPDAQLVWGAGQQAQIITRTGNAAELTKDWMIPSNPCVSDGTKVLPGTSAAGSCEITINTVEFVAR